MEFAKPAAYKSINSSSVIISEKEKEYEDPDLYADVGVVITELVDGIKNIFFRNPDT